LLAAGLFAGFSEYLQSTVFDVTELSVFLWQPATAKARRLVADPVVNETDYSAER